MNNFENEKFTRVSSSGTLESRSRISLLGSLVGHKIFLVNLWIPRNRD